jgi:hypothetical protein
VKERITFYREMGRNLRVRRERLYLEVQTVSKMSGIGIGEIREIERGDTAIECYPFFMISEVYERLEDDEKTTKSP